MKSYRLVAPYFKENLHLIIAGILCLMAVDLLQLFIPRIIKWTVDDLTLYRVDAAGLGIYALYILLTALGIGVLRYCWRRFLIGTSRRVEEGLRNRLFRHVQTLSAGYFDGTRTGDLMALATNDMTHIRMAVGMGMVALTDALFLGTTAMAFMAYINVRLTAFALIPMPLIAISAKYFSKKMHRRYQQVQAAFADITETVRERFAGIRIVKAYNREAAALDKVGEKSTAYIGHYLVLTRITGAFFPLMILFTNLSLGIVIFLGGRLTLYTEITTGDFVAFISYLNLMTWPMMALGWVINLIQRGGASLDRIDLVLKTRPEIRSPEAGKSPSGFQGRIVFEKVSFTFPKAKSPSLKDIDLEIQPGQTFGIVGPPGSGKTTLLNLIPRLYDVASGRITLDGIDLRDLDLEMLRAAIVGVPQEPFIFSGTIGQNITFAMDLEDSLQLDATRLDRSLTAAALKETLAEFPKGLDTLVGENGVLLSGGQKQRIALARAFYRQAPILLLDDPVSQVDAETAARIMAHISNRMGPGVTLIASHRLSALRHAARILVMKSGRIETGGDHETLMQTDNYYSRTYRMQELEDH